MNVRVKHESLTPGVKHTEATGIDMQAALSDVGQSAASGLEQQRIEQAWCVECDDIQIIGTVKTTWKYGTGRSSAERASIHRLRATT